MKAMMILGAMIGFILGAAGSLKGDCAAATTFWHAAVCALVGGVLAGWWGRLLFTNLADALEHQRRARLQAAAESKTNARV